MDLETTLDLYAIADYLADPLDEVLERIDMLHDWTGMIRPSLSVPITEAGGSQLDLELYHDDYDWYLRLDQRFGELQSYTRASLHSLFRTARSLGGLPSLAQVVKGIQELTRQCTEQADAWEATVNQDPAVQEALAYLQSIETLARMAEKGQTDEEPPF